jgi:hypothetical protein
MSGPKAPKTFEEWVEAYEERDSDTEYVLTPGERVVYDPARGFFTYSFDAANREILIPKMCGDGRHWRKKIYELYLATRRLGVRGVYCCTKRNPAAYMRVLGGRLVKMEHSYDFVTGKERTLWYIFISPDDTKEGRGDNDGPDSDTGAGIPAGAA